PIFDSTYPPPPFKWPMSTAVFEMAVRASVASAEAFAHIKDDYDSWHFEAREQLEAVESAARRSSSSRTSASARRPNCDTRCSAPSGPRRPLMLTSAPCVPSKGSTPSCLPPRRSPTGSAASPHPHRQGPAGLD